MLSVLLGVEVDVDVLIFGEGEIEVQWKDEVGIDYWFFYDKIIEMGVAVPHVVVVEEPPVDAILAENSLDLSHLPA